MPAVRSFAVISAAVTTVAVLALAGAAVAAPERSHSVRIEGPTRIVQGDKVTMTVSARAGTRCSLTLRYRSGKQRVRPVTAVRGKAVFTFVVPRRARPGAATVRASCGSAGSTSRQLVVIGSVIAPEIKVLKHGFSVRVHRFGGSTVSWGVVLQNTAPRQDAVNVYVLANFVLPDNTLIGSMSRRVSRIGANSMGVVGGDLHFRGAPPIARLEVTVQVREGVTPQKAVPNVANEHVVRDLFEPEFVASVEGEVANDDLHLRLRRAELYAVALDGAGNVLGGGVGMATASLPPGAREFFKISGLRGVRADAVASLIVAVVPTYDS